MDVQCYLPHHDCLCQIQTDKRWLICQSELTDLQFLMTFSCHSTASLQWGEKNSKKFILKNAFKLCCQMNPTNPTWINPFDLIHVLEARADFFLFLKLGHFLGNGVSRKNAFEIYLPFKGQWKGWKGLNATNPDLLLDSKT